MGSRWSTGDFRDGACTALWAHTVSGIADEYKIGPGAGGDWLDFIPNTPSTVSKDVARFIDHLEQVNGVELRLARFTSHLIALAEAADGASIDPWELGFYLMSQALGVGVSWWDDHERFPLKIPHFEPSPETYNAAQKWVENEAAR